MKFIITTLLFSFSFHLFGQTIDSGTLISHSNYYRSNQGTNLQSSFGELTTEVITENDLTLSQGFIQTFMQLVPIKNYPELTLEVNVGPIPCTNSLVVNKNEDNPLIAHLSNLNGRILQTNLLADRQTNIDVSKLPSGSYFLTITNKKQQLFKTIKIIKQ